jgi:hypothetical protein
VKIALAIFRSVEVFYLPPDHDISTVKQQPTYELNVIKDILKYIPSFVRKLNRLSYRDLFYHFTVKNGPNGPALTTSDTDLVSVRQDIKLYSSIKTISEILNDTKFPPDEFEPDKPVGLHSKLTQFSAKAGKTRTIAVIDYYSQRALHPLHQALMDLLKSLESDGTFSHRNVGNYVQEKTKEKSFIQTSDMTAFTDLFPAILQQKLLYCLVEDRNLATSWWNLLSKRTFKVAWNNDYVNYGTGQPMGAYASWAICTLAHHMIVHYSAYKLRIKNVNTLYRIIGDDNAISHEKLALTYKETLTAIGCKLNPYKGTCSTTGIEYSSAEVAKRLYLNGIDISPLTPGIIKSLTNPLLVNTGIGDLLTIYDDPTLPIQILERMIPKDKRNRVLMLCTNPYNGVIKPGMPGYENANTIWGDLIRSGHYRNVMVRFRVESLQNKANLIMADNIGPYGSWARMTVKSTIKDPGYSGNNTVPQYAQVECRRHLLSRLRNIIETLDEVVASNSDFDLTEVEYMPDPRNPFLDSKEVRDTHASLLVEKCYHFLSSTKNAANEGDNDVTTDTRATA